MTKEEDLCTEDLIWTEDDMDHFLNTVASFETHKQDWKARREERAVRGHPEHGKQMPRLIPPSYVRLFQITLSQTHSSKFREQFGAMAMDGTLHTPSMCSRSRKGWLDQLPRWLNQLPW